MKKQQIAAAACLVAGAIGFAAVYSTQKPGKDEIPTEISQTSSIVETTAKKTHRSSSGIPVPAEQRGFAQDL